MYLKSKIDLNYNLPIAGQESGVVFGTISFFEMDGEFTAINANYKYSIISENQEVVLAKGKFSAVKEELDQLYDVTDALMPGGLTSKTEEQFRRYAAFKQEMFKSFSVGNPDLTLDDIEIIWD